LMWKGKNVWNPNCLYAAPPLFFFVFIQCYVRGDYLTGSRLNSLQAN